jgi:hypothetical protein
MATTRSQVDPEAGTAVAASQDILKVVATGRMGQGTFRAGADIASAAQVVGIASAALAVDTTYLVALLGRLVDLQTPSAAGQAGYKGEDQTENTEDQMPRLHLDTGPLDHLRMIEAGLP